MGTTTARTLLTTLGYDDQRRIAPSDPRGGGGGVHVGFFFFFFFFFFCRVEAPSDSRSNLTVCPTLGKACSLELSTLVTRGNAVKQTSRRWGWQYRRVPRLQSRGTVGLQPPSYANSDHLPTKTPRDRCPG